MKTNFSTHRVNRLSVLLLCATLIAATSGAWAQRGRRGGRGGGEVTKVDPATASKLKGKVTLDGAAPENKSISMDADPVCTGAHEGEVSNGKVVVNDKNELGDVFVYISGGLEGKTFEVSDDKAMLSQHGCMFEPAVMGVQVGQTLTIHNGDPTLHNVHAMSKSGDLFNLAMPSKDMEIDQKFRSAEVMVKVKCDVHPWMFAYIGVLDHPYFAVTDENGDYEISNLPPGEYKLTAWHRVGKRVSRMITVGESQTVKADFKLNLEKKKK